MKIKICVSLPTGESADFTAHLNTTPGASLEKDVYDSDLTFGFSGDEKIGRDVRSLVADLLSDRFNKKGA